MTQASYLPVFTNPAAEAETMAAYQAVMARWPLPFEELEIPTSLGLTHVVASGPQDAPPVVLLHAFFASAAAWQPTAAGLSDAFRLYAVDIIGEPNRSRPTRAIKSMDEQVLWFKELLDGLRLRETYLVGNSFGGFLSVYYALRLPERIRKMALIAPADTFHSMLPFYLRSFLPKFLYMFFPKVALFKRWCLAGTQWLLNDAPVDADWAEFFRRVMLHGTGARYLFPSVFPAAQLQKLTTPTLLLVGDKEVIYPPQAVIRAAQQRVSGLRAVIVPNANHFAALSQPELVNAHIRSFFC